ncbi:peptidase [Altererythrobacter xixiisoli]|uniref:Peptidase n=1 Tax=Croceibacterium xixiisoli TaxID=1476466 RepID=A0A6I4TQD1_9SPHN|nr:PepSY domain-containing protein [Croceibacterium xixiisoli]MXO98066.1 peptidase [Croceibacterium xixiisoli]
MSSHSPSRAIPGRTGDAPRFTGLRNAGRWARRTSFLVHRWLGVALALLMALWTLSGIVMMYVSFPETTREERLAGLAPLDLTACCDKAYLPGGVPITAAQVEMVAGEPMLRWQGPAGPGIASLANVALPDIGPEQAATVARDHVQRAFGLDAQPVVEQITRDQWTVYGRFRQYGPLYKASFADDRGTQLYIASGTGEVVQDTSAHERFWNWLGAVPHWLYFTALRENQPLWSNLVTYASLLGLFLTVTGIYVGIRQYGRGKRLSPYRGMALWHHWTGLIFGIVTLTWVFSGLVSMQPWGTFESEGPGQAIERLEGRPLAEADITTLFTALRARPQPGVVSAEVVMQAGQPVAILSAADGSMRRATLPDLTAAPLSAADLRARAASARPDVPLASAEMITRADAYYYGHHTDVVLPAYRAIYADEGQTRLYFDPRSGEVVSFSDSTSRLYRWLHYGLHRLDFAVLRERPLWDAVMLPLLAGVSALCLLGVWMGVRRLRIKARGKR